jgi:hypothetical protein
MNKIQTLALAGIFIPGTILALALEGYATRTLIPQWCDESPICRASRTATSSDPIRF